MKRLAPLLLLAACSSATPKNLPVAPDKNVPVPPETKEQALQPNSDPGEAREPDSWADWQSYVNVSPGPWISKTHGKRFVAIYVNEVALEAYKTPGATLPVGSIIVKPSWKNEDGKPGAEGPLFIMEKMAAGFAPERDDWIYAFQWADPPEKWQAELGSNVDLRSPSEKVEYCGDCHDGIDRGLGMPPVERRATW